MKTLTTFAVAALLSIATGCATSRGEAPEDGAGAAAQSVGDSVTVQTVVVDESRPARDASTGDLMTTCAIEGTYLRVSGIASTTAARALNDALLPVELGILDEGGCERAFVIETSTSVLLNEKGILSVTRSGNEHYAGMAHTNNTFYVQSFSTTTGRKLEIADVFSDAIGAEFAAALYAELLSGTPEQKSMAEAYGDRFRSQPDRISFALTKEGVEVCLTPFAGHADFALAAEPITLRYADVRNILSARSPAAPLWDATATSP